MGFFHLKLCLREIFKSKFRIRTEESIIHVKIEYDVKLTSQMIASGSLLVCMIDFINL